MSRSAGFLVRPGRTVPDESAWTVSVWSRSAISNGASRDYLRARKPHARGRSCGDMILRGIHETACHHPGCGVGSSGRGIRDRFTVQRHSQRRKPARKQRNDQDRRNPFDEIRTTNRTSAARSRSTSTATTGATFNAKVTFIDWSPTKDAGLSVTSGQGNPSTVFIGEDDNSGGGSTAGLDASETYTLAFSGRPSDSRASTSSSSSTPRDHRAPTRRQRSSG